MGNRTPLSRGWHLTTLPKSPNAICPTPSFAKMIWSSLEKQGKYSSSITCKTEYATLVCLFLGNTPLYSLELWDSCISKEFLNVNPRFKLGTLEALEVKEVLHYILNLFFKLYFKKTIFSHFAYLPQVLLPPHSPSTLQASHGESTK